MFTTNAITMQKNMSESHLVRLKRAYYQALRGDQQQPQGDEEGKARKGDLLSLSPMQRTVGELSPMPLEEAWETSTRVSSPTMARTISIPDEDEDAMMIEELENLYLPSLQGKAEDDLQYQYQPFLTRDVFSEALGYNNFKVKGTLDLATNPPATPIASPLSYNFLEKAHAWTVDEALVMWNRSNNQDSNTKNSAPSATLLTLTSYPFRVVSASRDLLWSNPDLIGMPLHECFDGNGTESSSLSFLGLSTPHAMVAQCQCLLEGQQYVTPKLIPVVGGGAAACNNETLYYAIVFPQEEHGAAAAANTNATAPNHCVSPLLLLEESFSSSCAFP